MGREHYIDWLRVIAIGLLLIYHITIIFQFFAKDVWFIQNPVLLKSIWIPMSLINTWRIPLLFFISGMGVFFSMKKRNWKQLIAERGRRILIPLIFGSIFVVPIHLFLFSKFYGLEYTYVVHQGHLWFLLNIFIYVSILLPIFYYFKRNPKNKFFAFSKKILNKNPLTLYLLGAPFILETMLIKTGTPYTQYFEGVHGFSIGLISFILGFYFISLGKTFWKAISKIRFFTLGTALALFLFRWRFFKLGGPYFLTAIESISWIFVVFGLAYLYLNKTQVHISYFSQAAYPIYIIHMAFMYAGAFVIVPLNINAWLKLIFITIITFTGSFGFYEFIIRRVWFIRPLFGLANKK